MSLIESPPAERKPIITQVKPYSESLIKSAIGAELIEADKYFICTIKCTVLMPSPDEFAACYQAPGLALVTAKWKRAALNAL